MFARIFGEDDDQILVRLQNDERGKPAVGIHFVMPNGMFTCHQTSFEDSDEGWAQAQRMLEGVTIEELRPVVAELTMAVDGS